MHSVCFLHLPKTSGTSLNMYFESQFERTDICPARSGDEFEAIGAARLSEWRYWRAESTASVLRLLPPGTPVVTMLRDPLDRIYSHWRYIQRLPEHRLHEQFQREHSGFDYFLESVVDNPLARLLAAPADAPACSVWELNGCEVDANDLFDRALGRLESFAFVGLIEHHNESVELIADLFGWSPPHHLPITNAAPRSASTPTIGADDRRRFEVRNEVDIELYKAATHLLRRRSCLSTPDERRSIYRRRIAAKAQPLKNRLVVDLSSPFHGGGWLPPVETEVGTIRPISVGCEATIDLPVVLGQFTKLQLACPAVTSTDVIDSLEISVNGQVVPFSVKPEPVGVTIQAAPPPGNPDDGFTTIGFRVASGGLEVPPNHTGAVNNMVATLAMSRLELISYDSSAMRVGSVKPSTNNAAGQRAARFFWQRSPAWTFDEELRSRLDEFDLWANVADLQRDGFTVVRDFIDRQTVARSRAAIQRLAKTSGHRTRRSDVMQPLRLDPLFVDLLLNPVQLALADAVCGKGLLDSQAGLIRDRSSNPQGLHAENALWLPAPYPEHHFICSAMLTLDDFDEPNGGTCFVPGSHLSRVDPTPEDSLSLKGTVTPEVGAGSLIVWLGGTWHGAHQRTVEGERVSLLTIFTRPSLRPAQDVRALPSTLLGEPELRLRLRHADPFEQSEWYSGDPEAMMHWIRNTPRDGDVTCDWDQVLSVPASSR